MLIPQITDPMRRDAFIARTSAAYELLRALMRLLEQTAPRPEDYPQQPLYQAEREHKARITTLRDLRDQCEMLAECAATWRT